MPCIRRKYHAAAVYLNPRVIGGKYPMCGQTVESLNGDEWRNTNFRGFSSINDVDTYGGVLIRGISGFTTNDGLLGDWLDFDVKSWLLGSISGDGVELVLLNNKPVVVNQQPPTDESPKKANNVFNIHRA